MSEQHAQQIRTKPHWSQKHTCPKCSGHVMRVPRRFVDRFVSLIFPVQRYKCLSPECLWEGNLRRIDDPATEESSEPSRRGAVAGLSGKEVRA